MIICIKFDGALRFIVIKLVINFILLLSFFLLAACQTDFVEKTALVKSTSTSWALKHYISGGFDGRVERVTLRSDGVIQIDDLMAKTTVSERIEDTKALGFIYSRLVIAKKQFENNTRDANVQSTINPKCRDCQTSSLSFEFNNVSYPIIHSMKFNGKVIYTELMMTINKLQKRSFKY